MDKIILKDGTSLEFSKVEGLSVSFVDKTVEDLEKIFTKENCSKVQLSTSAGEVYGTYNNLECSSIVKILADSSVTVYLNELDNTALRISILETAISDLGTVVSELVEGSVQ